MSAASYDTAGCYGDLFTIHCTGTWWLIPLMLLVLTGLAFALLVFAFGSTRRYPVESGRRIFIPVWQAFLIYMVASFVAEYVSTMLRNFWVGLLVLFPALALTYALDGFYRRRANT